MKYTKEILELAISKASSWSEVCRIIGVKEATGMQFHLRNRALFFGISSSHFTGQSWRYGRTFDKKPIEDYLVKSDKMPKTHSLRLRLISEGIKEHKCEICHRKDWMDIPIPLELDHINGDKKDSRLENLRILCPNCHAQTSTYCRRKDSLIPKKKKEHKQRIILKGVEKPNHILNEQDVVFIRNSAETNIFLAKKYGVSDSLISAIRKLKKWRT